MTTEFGYPRRQYSGCRQIDLVLKEGHSDQSPCLACHEIRWQRECAGRNASERRASLEKDNAQADPMGFSGKADTAGVNERSSTPSRCAGVVATACTQGKRTQHGKPQGVVREDQPDAREGQIGRLGASRVAYAFLVYMLSPLPRRSGWAYCFAHSPQPYQPSPKTPSGRPAHCPFRGLLGVHLRYGLHTRAATVFRDTLSRGIGLNGPLLKLGRFDDIRNIGGEDSQIRLSWTIDNLSSYRPSGSNAAAPFMYAYHRGLTLNQAAFQISFGIDEDEDSTE